jgi:hypothetical protein
LRGRKLDRKRVGIRVQSIEFGHDSVSRCGRPPLWLFPGIVRMSTTVPIFEFWRRTHRSGTT